MVVAHHAGAPPRLPGGQRQRRDRGMQIPLRQVEPPVLAISSSTCPAGREAQVIPQTSSARPGSTGRPPPGIPRRAAATAAQHGGDHPGRGRGRAGDVLPRARPVHHQRHRPGRRQAPLQRRRAWPHSAVCDDPPAVIYPARGIGDIWQPAPRSDEDLARLIGRARAVLLIALAEPASTTGLAARTGIPVSSVSEHLAILRAAGLVSTTRTGRYLMHQRTALGVALAR